MESVSAPFPQSFTSPNLQPVGWAPCGSCSPWNRVLEALPVNPKGSLAPLTSVMLPRFQRMPAQSPRPPLLPPRARQPSLPWSGRGPSHQVARIMLQCEQSGGGPERPGSVCPAPGAGWAWVSLHGVLSQAPKCRQPCARGRGRPAFLSGHGQPKGPAPLIPHQPLFRGAPAPSLCGLISALSEWNSFLCWGGMYCDCAGTLTLNLKLPLL